MIYVIYAYVVVCWTVMVVGLRHERISERDVAVLSHMVAKWTLTGIVCITMVATPFLPALMLLMVVARRRRR